MSEDYPNKGPVIERWVFTERDMHYAYTHIHVSLFFNKGATFGFPGLWRFFKSYRKCEVSPPRN